MRRRDWWLVQLIVSALQMLVSAALWTFARGLYSQPGFGGIPVATWIELGFAVVMLGPILVANVRRAHDRDRSGRVAVLVQLGMLVLSFFAFPLGGEPDMSSPQVVMALFGMMMGSLYLLFGLGVPDGTPGPNRFGPSPKSGQQLL